jgi:hypothetical protein
MPPHGISTPLRPPPAAGVRLNLGAALRCGSPALVAATRTCSATATIARVSCLRCIDTPPVLPERDGGCAGVQAMREAGQGGALARGQHEPAAAHVRRLRGATGPSQRQQQRRIAIAQRHGGGHWRRAKRGGGYCGIVVFEGRQPGSLAAVDEAEAEDPAADVEGRVQTVVRAVRVFLFLSAS